jgi:hypothetical protein
MEQSGTEGTSIACAQHRNSATKAGEYDYVGRVELSGREKVEVMT